MNDVNAVFGTALDAIPYAAIQHPADETCRRRGWHTNECYAMQTRAQEAAIGFGVALVGLALLALLIGRR